MFIVLEGIDGCGKSTQAGRLSEWLEARVGLRVVTTFEPGGWSGGGAEMRSAILGGDYRSELARYFMFIADRLEHAARVIVPALASGAAVICDRYTPSSIAYQLFGGGVPEPARSAAIAAANGIGLPEPDAVVWLDLTVAEARGRLAAREKRDAFDARGEDFFERVRSAYAGMASGEAWITANASGAEYDVFSRVVSALEQRLPFSGWAPCP